MIAAVSRVTAVTALLLFVDFLDELSSGVPFVGAPGIQSGFGVTYGEAAGWVLAAMMALGVLETPLFLMADRISRKWFICGGLGALGLVCVAAGLASQYSVLFGCLLIFGPLSGCGVGLSQAALMDLHPDERERMMTRWTFLGCVGDLATPALFTGLALIGLGWRAAFGVCGVVLIAWAALLAGVLSPEMAGKPDHDPGDEGPAPGMRETLARAVAHRPLLGWNLALLLCSLLDEILVAFGSLHMRDHLGAGVPERGAILGAGMIGGMLGLVVLDRLLTRFPPMLLLAASGLCGSAFYLAWLGAATPMASGIWLFMVIFSTSFCYPITKAQAYRSYPGSAATVNALGSLFTPFEIAMPLVLGAIADHLGLRAALLCLLAQPLLLGLTGLTLHLGRHAAAPRRSRE